MTFVNNIALVIGPVPPGVGEKKPATSLTWGSISPMRPFSVLVIPTSTTAAPFLIMFGLTKWGTPVAAITMSALIK